MATKIFKTTFQFRRDTTENWRLNKDVIPAAGEPCFDLDLGTLKIGDGVTTYENLPAINAGEISSVAAHYEGTRADGEDDNAVIARVLAEAGATANKDDIFIVKTLISDDKYSYTAYVYNGTNWVAMDGNYNADNVYFSNDMLVTKEIGYITLSNGQGTIPSKGKNLSEVFEAMFVQEQNPTTTQPKVNLAFSQAKAYEVGTVVSPSYTATFDDGNYTYGPDPTGATVTSWEISDTDGNTAATASGSFAAVTVADSTNYKITAKANYTAGEIPVTNKQNPYEAGRIAAGSKSATSSAITGYRSFFYGVLDTSSADAPLTSEIVRGLTNGGAYTGTKTFTLNGSATAKRIIIAIPASSTRSGLKEVILTSAMNTPVTDSYVKTANAVQVEGVNGATAVDYNVWCYEPASIDAGEVHKITLS